MKQSKGESGMEKTKEEKRGCFSGLLMVLKLLVINFRIHLSVYDPDRGGNCSFCDICRCFCDL